MSTRPVPAAPERLPAGAAHHRPSTGPWACGRLRPTAWRSVAAVAMAAAVSAATAAPLAAATAAATPTSPSASAPAANPQRSPRWQPWQAEAPVPPARHQPVLDGRPPLPATALPWPEANAIVGRIGGWRAYAREAQGDPPAAQAPAAPPTPPTPAASAHRHGH